MKKLNNISIRTEKHLAMRLNFPLQKILDLAETPKYKDRKKLSKGGGKDRRLDPPSEQLKALQKRINDKLLNRLEIDGEFYGAIKGRSAFTNAIQHVGKDIVLSIDLKDFFPSIRPEKVYRLFCELGCAPTIARILTRLTTYSHSLPQGAPTSPMIANLLLRKANSRIKTLFNKFKFNQSVTIYYDDITVSGNHEVKEFKNIIIKILRQEGFSINIKKLRLAPRWAQQKVTGYIVNGRSDNPRVQKDYIRNLRALINNSRRDGILSQKSKYWEIQGKELTRKSMRGKIAHIKYSSPKKGTTLLKEFNLID